MGLASALFNLRRSPRRAFVYVPLNIGLGVLLFLGIFGVLSLLIIGFFLFAVPYWFGERRVRMMGLAAVVTLIGIALVVGAFIADLNAMEVPGIQDSPNSLLRDGTVSPLRGTADSTPFNFTVVYTNGTAPVEGPYLNLTDRGGLVITASHQPMVRGTNTSTGHVYFANTTLPASFITFHFAVRAPNGTWVTTLERSTGREESIGPATVSVLGLYGLFLPQILASFFLYSVVPIPVFPLILLLFWWSRQVKMRRGRLMAARGQCANCGASLLDPEAKECPVCGKPVAPAGGGELTPPT